MRCQCTVQQASLLLAFDWLHLLLGRVLGTQQLPTMQAFLSGAEPRLTVARKGMCPHLARTSFESMFLFVCFFVYLLSTGLRELLMLMNFIAFYEAHFCHFSSPFPYLGLFNCLHAIHLPYKRISNFQLTSEMQNLVFFTSRKVIVMLKEIKAIFF